MNGSPQVQIFSTLRHWLLAFVSASTWLAAVSPCQNAVGDFVVSVDFDPMTSGIQSSLTVEAGQAFSAYIVLEYNDTVGLDSYRFSMQYDSVFITADTVSDSPPADFVQGLAGPPILQSGLITPFSAESAVLFSGPLNIDAMVVGIVGFTAGTTAGNYLISPFEDPVLRATERTTCLAASAISTMRQLLTHADGSLVAQFKTAGGSTVHWRLTLRPRLVANQLF